MTDQPQPPPQQPTAEEQQQMQQIASAGAQAAAQGDDPAPAMRAERDRVEADIPDEVIDKIATAVSQQNIAALREAGAFDPPPEPVQPPQQPAAPPSPTEQQGQAAPEARPAPQKRTWAHRFMGTG